MSITIALADDHELVRKGIAALLKSEPDFEIVGECSTGRELVELVGRVKPKVIITDIVMPSLNGVDAVLRLKEWVTDVRIIALSMYTDVAYVRAMLEAGAVGYVVKSGVATDLIQAVRYAMRGKIYLSSAVSATVQTLQRIGPQQRSSKILDNELPRLSSREREVLQLVAEGHSAKEIAGLLYIKESTVKTHRKNIMEKLNIHEIAGLTRYAIQIGLVRNEL